VKQKFIPQNFSRGRQVRRHHQLLVRVLQIEAAMVSWNRTGIKKALKLGLLIEELLKGNIREFWAGDKAVDQNSNEVVTRSNGVKCRNTLSNLELFSLSDLLGPVLEISCFFSKVLAEVVLPS
jgi:hypothetical protein